MRGIPICMPCQSALRAYTIADSVLFKIIRLYLYPMAYEQMQGGQCIMNCARLMVSHACLACNAFVCVVCAVCMRQHQWHAYYRNYMGAVSGINVQYNQWQHMCCVQPVYWRGISLLWGRVHWRVKANRQFFLFSVISLVKICVRSAGVDRSAYDHSHHTTARTHAKIRSHNMYDMYVCNKTNAEYLYHYMHVRRG